MLALTLSDDIGCRGRALFCRNGCNRSVGHAQVHLSQIDAFCALLCGFLDCLISVMNGLVCWRMSSPLDSSRSNELVRDGICNCALIEDGDSNGESRFRRRWPAVDDSRAF